MIKDFKFLRTEQQKFLDDGWYRLYEPYIPLQRTQLQTDPPYGLSRRHWNLLPERLRNAPERDITDYLDGWEARRNNNFNNSHHIDLHRAELWNSGFWDCANRIGTTEQVGELREHLGNESQTHGFTVGVHNTPLRLEYEGNMDMESVRAMIWDLQFRYANYVSINEQVIDFMEDHLNQHLNGISRIIFA